MYQTSFFDVSTETEFIGQLAFVRPPQFFYDHTPPLRAMRIARSINSGRPEGTFKWVPPPRLQYERLCINGMLEYELREKQGESNRIFIRKTDQSTVPCCPKPNLAANNLRRTRAIRVGFLDPDLNVTYGSYLKELPYLQQSITLHDPRTRFQFLAKPKKYRVVGIRHYVNLHQLHFAYAEVYVVIAERPEFKGIVARHSVPIIAPEAVYETVNDVPELYAPTL